MSKKRQRLVNSERFKKAKEIRERVLGSLCEICQRVHWTCGHHVYGLEKSNWDHIQLRCAKCEVRAHMNFKHGNTDESLRIFFRNNVVIANAISPND